MKRVTPVWLTALLAGLLLALHGQTGLARDGEVQADYLLHCGGCHLPDGRGVPPDMPTLRTLGRLAALPDGRRYLARVPGAAHAPLTDAALADVINWVLRQLGDEPLPPDFAPLTASEVGAARRDVLLDPVQERARIWAAYDLGER